MKPLANNRGAAWLGAFGITVCVLAAAAIRAEDMTPQTLLDRAEIEDLITRYYYNFGNENSESFPNFYADDAELILGETVKGQWRYKTRQIMGGTKPPEGWKE